MYSLAIYLYMFMVRLAALFNRKARLMMRGHRNTWKILRREIRPDARYVWFHAASLGEFEQGRPLMERMRREHPEKKILLTFFSPSGYEVRKDYDGADVVCYLPFDTPLNARKFVRLAHPETAFFIKYEFWRNYIDVLYHKSIPCYSVSSIFRPEQIFFRSYGRRYARVLKRMTHLFVQNEYSRQLLADRLGITHTTVVGDTRMDRVVSIMEQAKPLPEVEQMVKGAPFVMVAGSTWPPDEDLIISYFNQHPELKLIMAPHVVSPEHLQQIESKLQRPTVRYSQLKEQPREADCLLIDCYGLLSAIYRYAQIAYVGGGFGVGIHNVPEAAVYGVPVIIGPNHHKFMEANDLLANGGCFEVKNAADFNTTVDHLLTHPEALRKASAASADYIHASAGATEKIYSVVYGK